jgi:hypothetical protein
MSTATDGIEYLLWRHELDDGEVTTLYAVRHPRITTRARVVHFPRTERLDFWCAANEVDEAIIGGFFVRDPYRPLRDLWIDGDPVPHEPIVPPFAARRACVASRTGTSALPRARSSPTRRPATSSMQGRCSSGTGRWSSIPTRTARDSPPGRAVRLGHHGGSLSAGGARGRE